MSVNVLPLYSPSLEQVIDSSLPIVSTNALLFDVLVQMSSLRGSSCALSESDDLAKLNSDRGSCVLVMAESRLVGIFTQRDLVRLTASQQDLKKVTIAEVMTHPVITLTQDEESLDVFTAIAMMRQQRIRHLPIVNSDGQLLGVLTSDSIRQALQPSNLFRIRRVGEVMTRQVITASPTTSVLQLAELMATHRVSCVVICHSSKDDRQIPVGIVTEGDILQFQVLELNLARIEARTVMSAPLFSLIPENSLWIAHQEMVARRVKRLVVTGDRGELLGIVTQTSLLRSLDPMEIYGVVQGLQQSVSQLEAEKVLLLENRNAELEQKVQERTAKLLEQAEKESLLARISTRIRQSLKLEHILNSIVTEVQNFLHCDRVIVYHFLPNYDGLVLAESVAPGYPVVMGDQIKDTCFTDDYGSQYIQGRKWVCDNIYLAKLTPCHLQLLESFQVKANLVVPISIGEQLWGLLIAHQCSEPRQWQEFELELLDQLSVQIAIAIQQAKAFEQAQTELLERQRTEQALITSKRRYASLAAAVPVGIFRCNTQCECLYVNERCCEMLGVTKEIILGQNWITRLHPEDRDRVIAQWNQAVRQKQPFRSEYRFIHTDGPVIWVLCQIVEEFSTNQEEIGYVGTLTDISDRKQAEEALQNLNQELELRIAQRTAELQESESQLKDFLENANDLIQSVAFNGRLLYVNRAWRETLDYSLAEVRYLSIFDIIHPDSQPDYRQALERVFKGEKCPNIESKFVGKYGKIIIVEGQFNCRFENGKPVATRGIFRDITERKHSETKLQNTMGKLENVLHELAFQKLALDRSAIVAITDYQGVITYANQKFCDISGYTIDEIIGQTHRIVKSGYHDKAFFQQMWETISAGEVWQGEVKNKSKNGKFYWVETTIVPCTDGQGKPFQYLAIRFDITQRKEAEEALRMSEVRFRSLFESAADFIHVVDLDGLIWQTNPISIEQSGYSELELIGYPLSSFFTPVSQNIFNEKFRDLLVTGTMRLEVEFLRKNGTIAYMDLSSSVVRNEAGECAYIVIIQRDISERKQAEQSLKQQLAAIEAAMDGIAILNEHSQYTYLNKAHVEMFGYQNTAELLGKNWQELYHPEHIKHFEKKVFPSLGSSGKWQGEAIAKRKDGSTFDEEVSLTLIEGVGLICVCRDITERKQAETLLAKRDRYLTALVEIQRQLLASALDSDLYNIILSILGPICEVSRIYVFENHRDATGCLLTSQRAEWCNTGIEPQINNPQLQNFPLENLLPTWNKQLAKGDIIEGIVKEFKEVESDILEQQGILSILLLPLIVKGEFFGFIGFDDCLETHHWDPLEISILSSAGAAISLAKERQLTEKALQEAKGQLQAVLDAVPGLVSWISSDLRYLGVNRHLADTFNLPSDSFIGKPIGFLDQTSEFGQFLSQFFANKSIYTESQIIEFKSNGKSHSYLIVAKKYNEGNDCVTVGIDITERQQVEEQIKASLKEKEVLLKEIHHRVKNNLQIISSLLDLQSQYIDDTAMNNLFADSQSRIQSMALIHEQLYQSKDLGNIDFSEYVTNLIENLVASYVSDADSIDYHISIEDIYLNLDTSIPCGLIINELVSNAFKHAFPNGREGKINVTIERNEQNFIILKVSDDGIGFPENLDFQQIESSLGLQLVCTLTKQLKGNIELDRSNGTSFTLTLSELTSRKKS